MYNKTCYMKTLKLNILSRMLCAVLLFSGLVLTSCGGGAGNGKGQNDTSYLDLSSSTSANCYIVSNSGFYKFKTVKGNSSESVGDVASASVLWESFGTSDTPNIGDLIKSVSCKDGYISFQTADTFNEGNAVIAAMDTSGAVLWSWHIWLTDQPQGQVYCNDAGIMMDRNLGATSATPGDIGALGLLYQWGRKDPFLGSSSINKGEESKSTITWPSAVKSNSENGTIAYATANPTTFILCNDKNKDWYFTGSSSTDNTRWTTLETPKSIYDPCPSGWRVPNGGDNGVWSRAFGSRDYPYDCAKGGINFSGNSNDASTIWYPAAGYRGRKDGILKNDNNDGMYWSCSPFERNPTATYAMYFYDDIVSPWGNIASRAYGCSVRCVQE